MTHQLVSPSSRPSVSRRLLAASSALIVAITACGGDSESDDAGADTEPIEQETASPSADDAPVDASAASDDGLADNEARDLFLDSEEGAEVEEAIGGLSSQTRFDIIADQMEPRPTVEVDGNDIRFVFVAGTIEFGPSIDCIIIDTLATDEETVTVVYPDGEAVC